MLIICVQYEIINYDYKTENIGRYQFSFSALVFLK